jgi:hypothetical protein
VEPPHELVDVAVGRRPDDGAGDDQMGIIAGAHFLQELAGGRALHVEDAQGVSRFDEAAGFRVLQGIEILPAQRPAAVGIDHGDAVPQHPEAAVPQDIDLDQAGVLGGVFFPGDHRPAQGGYLAVGPLAQGPRGDDHPAGVGAQETGDAPDRHGFPTQPFGEPLALPQLPEPDKTGDLLLVDAHGLCGLPD